LGVALLPYIDKNKGVDTQVKSIYLPELSEKPAAGIGTHSRSGRHAEVGDARQWTDE
jgi:hypothetical protein